MTLQSQKWLWSTIAAGCLAAGANAQFSDNFNSYALGSVINGQGGWKQWDSAPNSTSVIVDNTTGFARSGRAVAVDAILAGETSDLVHEFTGINSGQYTVKGYTYCPTGNIDKWYFLLLNTYNDFGPYDWSVQVTMDPSAGLWTIDAGSASTAQGNLIFDQWVELKAQIDFNTNLVEVFYNGTLCAPAYSWTGGVFGGGAGALNLACIDLYHDPATTTPSGREYWDDVSVTVGFPPPGPITYCVAKTNALGCTPAIGGSGQASATQPSGFVVSSTNNRNQKSGLLFYGSTGQAATPFQQGTLCVKSPVRRTPAINSGGSPLPTNNCTGVYQIDMNAFRAGALGGNPAPFLSVAGTVVDCQFWGRDPGFAAPNNTSLSDGLEYTVGP